jgi:rubredoxin
MTNFNGLLCSEDFKDYMCPMCGSQGGLLGVLGQLVHMRCSACGIDYDFDMPFDDSALMLSIHEREQDDIEREQYDADLCSEYED